MGLGRRKNIEVIWGRTGLCQHMGQPQLFQAWGYWHRGAGQEVVVQVVVQGKEA